MYCIISDSDLIQSRFVDAGHDARSFICLSGCLLIQSGGDSNVGHIITATAMQMNSLVLWMTFRMATTRSGGTSWASSTHCFSKEGGFVQSCHHTTSRQYW